MVCFKSMFCACKMNRRILGALTHAGARLDHRHFSGRNPMSARIFKAISCASLLVPMLAHSTGLVTTTVTKIDAYAGANGAHYVWFAAPIGGACPNGAITFDGTGDGGHALYVLLLTALTLQKSVVLNIDGNGNGCNLLEAYISN